MLELKLDESALRPLIRLVIAEVLAEMDELQKGRSDRVAYTEAEAASMLALNKHQLRDIRLSGKINYTTIVGRRVRYTRADLMAYLNRERREAEA